MSAVSTPSASFDEEASSKPFQSSSRPSAARSPAATTGDAIEFDGSIVHDSDVVGAGSGLRDVVARVESVAPTDAPVMLEGETGSGKEVIARMIHARSQRADSTLVP